MKPVIGIEGIADLNRALRKLDADAPKQLRSGLNDAADLLITKTVPLIPKRSGAAARSLKARSTRTAARVGMGGRRAPYTPWLDFGGRVGRNDSAAREFIPDGRYLFPTLGRIRPQIVRQLQVGLVAVAESAGLEVT